MKPCRKIGIPFSSFDGERLKKIIAAADGFAVVDISDGDPENHIEGCEIIFGWVSSEMLKNAKALKWLHTQSAGVDALLGAANGFPGDVILTNSSGAYGIGISEYLITITMMLLKRMNEYVLLQDKKEWRYAGGVKSIYGSRVTVVGLGDIGENYARRCSALGAVVCGVVRTARDKKPDFIEKIYTSGEIDEALRDADIVTLCMPETNETKKMFTRERMMKMKKGSFILNIGRGSAIDHEALADLIAEGFIGGAGLDVTDPEPLPADSPLWKMPNVIITPHVSGGHSLGLTLDMIADKFIDYLRDYAAGNKFKRVVDFNAGY